MITVQSPSKNGAALVNYVLDPEAHNNAVSRNLYVTTVNLMPSPDNDPSDYLRQLRHEWTLAHDRHVVQMRHMIFAASRKEYGVSEENAIEFGETVKKYIKEYFPDRRAVIGVQCDTKGFYVDSKDMIIRDKNGKAVRDEEKAKKISGDENVHMERVLHAHVALSDAAMSDQKGIGKIKSRFSYLVKTFDPFFVKETGIEIDMGERRGKSKYLKGKLSEELKTEDGMFISFKADLADRIDQCIGTSKTFDEFIEKLPDYGVIIRTNKSGIQFHENEKHGKYVTFQLVDQTRTIEGQRNNDGSLRICSLRSYNFDEEGYDLASIEKRIASGETYEPSAKKKKSVGDYMKQISGNSDYSFLDDVNKENTKYWTEMAARLYEPDESEEEKPKKCTPVRGYDRTSKRTETGKQDTISEPVIKKQEAPASMAPASMAPPEANPMVADLMARAEQLAQKQREESQRVYPSFGMKH